MTIDEHINYLIEQIKELHDEPKTLSEDDVNDIIEVLNKAKQITKIEQIIQAYNDRIEVLHEWKKLILIREFEKTLEQKDRFITVK